MDERADAAAGTTNGGASGGGSGPGGLWLGIIGVLLVAVAGVWVWKEVAVGEVRGRLATVEDSLVEARERALADRTRELLRLSGVPLAWALRPEMIRRNYDQVNAYLTEFVQEPGVERVLVGLPGDSIVAATDKRLEGRPFSELLPAGLLELTGPRVEAADGGTLRLSVPVLGPTRSLGVLVVTYRPPAVPGGAGGAADTAADTGRGEAGAETGR